MNITSKQLKQIIREEIERVYSEGFGEGRPADDELSQKRDVYLEAEGEEVLAAIEGVPDAAKNIAAKMRADIEKMAEPSGLDPSVLLQAVAALLTVD